MPANGSSCENFRRLKSLSPRPKTAPEASLAQPGPRTRARRRLRRLRDARRGRPHRPDDRRPGGRDPAGEPPDPRDVRLPARRAHRSCDREADPRALPHAPPGPAQRLLAHPVGPPHGRRSRPVRTTPRRHRVRDRDRPAPPAARQPAARARLDPGRHRAPAPRADAAPAARPTAASPRGVRAAHRDERVPSEHRHRRRGDQRRAQLLMPPVPRHARRHLPPAGHRQPLLAHRRLGRGGLAGDHGPVELLGGTPLPAPPQRPPRPGLLQPRRSEDAERLRAALRRGLLHRRRDGQLPRRGRRRRTPPPRGPGAHPVRPARALTTAATSRTSPSASWRGRIATTPPSPR